MAAQNPSLVDLSHTGSWEDEGGIEEESRVETTENIPVILKVPTSEGDLFLFGTGATLTQSIRNNWLDETSKNIFETQWQQELKRERAFFEELTTGEQLHSVKRFMGLNILELAAILQVSRPTVYEWLQSKDIKMRQKNEQRLNTLNKIAKIWKAKKVGVLGSYLHKSLNDSGESLFTLLKGDDLDLNRIKQYLDKIAQLIEIKQQQEKEHEELLRKHGFEPVSREDMEDRLNDIDFMEW